jgi:hypothetical protein
MKWVQQKPHPSGVKVEMPLLTPTKSKENKCLFQMVCHEPPAQSSSGLLAQLLKRLVDLSPARLMKSEIVTSVFNKI